LGNPAQKIIDGPGLYWCWTPDHDEDWFIIAPSQAGAAIDFADRHGYPLHKVRADRVLSTTGVEAGADTRAATDADIRGLGGELLPTIHRETALHRTLNKRSRIAIFDGIPYFEGDLVGNSLAGIEKPTREPMAEVLRNVQGRRQQR